MSTSKQIKGLLAGFATVAVMGAAMAQGNPPNPAIKNAPEGAGQQSSQNTPMGTTGTPSGAPMTTGKSSMGTSSNMGTANTGMSNSGMATPISSSLNATMEPFGEPHTGASTHLVPSGSNQLPSAPRMLRPAELSDSV